ncbi:MAG: cellulase family glycosylhydrolase, partial [Candidatus Dormibacteraeota bacterium]|nr:cellulase family glycosylhydrolase [Candidatus Dormibacteraeota bacterium]
MRRWLVLTALVTLVVLLGWAVGARPQPSATSTRLEAQRSAPCAAPDAQNAVFSRVEGNHLLDTHHRVIMPYGVTLYGLARPHWQGTVTNQEWLMRGAMTEWCTNFIRIELSPAALLARSPYDPGYVHAIEAQVAYAASWNQNVILAAQTEWDAGGAPVDPTRQTVRFWRTLAPLFRSDPRVWFDLFNEPRLNAGPASWQVWQQGGTVHGRSY